MKQFGEFIKKHFMFLQRYGYIRVYENSENSVSLVGKNNRIDITFSTIGYELTCQFVDGAENVFSLQDGLGYAGINEFKGLYQISNKAEIEKGVVYLADAVNNLFIKIDVSDCMNFQSIYQYRLEMRKQLLNDYYLKNDLKKAEEYWGKGEYDKAQELYEKHVSNLSKAQRKKLKYIEKVRKEKNH